MNDPLPGCFLDCGAPVAKGFCTAWEGHAALEHLTKIGINPGTSRRNVLLADAARST